MGKEMLSGIWKILVVVLLAVGCTSGAGGGGQTSTTNQSLGSGPELVEPVSTRIMTKNSAYWYFGYKFTLRNPTGDQRRVYSKVSFFDDSGFLVGKAVEIYGIPLNPYETREFSESFPIEAELAPGVATVTLTDYGFMRDP